MKVLISALLGLSLFSPLGNIPTHSIQPLQMATAEGDRTICTVFSINEQAQLWATAAHCVVANWEREAGEPIAIRPTRMGGKPTKVVFADTREDMAVLQSEVSAPAIPRGDRPKVGDKVKVYGYMWGVAPTFFQGAVANLNARGFMIFDMRVGHGHSGAPVLDSDGHVVSIMQITSEGFSGGAIWGMLDELSPYWQD